jgi:hypothetical protein
MANFLSELYSPLKTFTAGKNVKHLAGLFGGDQNVTVMALLDSAGFVASGGRANATSADHVSACIQPSRRVAPMLVPEGLGPSTHLAVALSLQHPFLRAPASSLLEQSTLARQHSNPKELVLFRLRAVEIMLLLSDALKSEYMLWLPYVGERIRPIVAKRHIPFCREISFVTAFGDLCVWPAYVLGLRMSGWAEPSFVLPTKVTVPSCNVDEYKTPTEDMNNRVLASMGPSGDDALDIASWGKSQKEFAVSTS